MQALNETDSIPVLNPALILVNIVLRTEKGDMKDPAQLGLLYIGTVVEKQGYDVKILTGENLVSSITNLVGQKEEWRGGSSPEKILLGFYINSDNEFEVIRTSRLIKELLPEVQIIFGGPLANVNAHKLIQHDSVDFVCQGDGEYLTLELLEKIKDDVYDYEKIDGLTYKKNGKFFKNKSREIIKKLDSLPIPNRNLDPDRARISPAMISTSRGCGFKCTFCYESTNRQYRYNSPEHVISEMIYLKDNFGIKCFSFTDDIFTTHKKRLLEICRQMRESFKPREDLFWFCEARVDTLSRHPHLIDEMKAAGLERIQIGVETGDQNVLDLYKKEITLDQVRSTVEKLNEVGVLSIYTNFIIGGAGETRETFQKSLDFMKEIMYLAPGRLECGTCHLSPYPGTDIRNNPRDYNVNFIDENMLTGTSLGGFFVETDDLNIEEIKLHKHAFVRELFGCMKDIVQKIDVSLIKEHLKVRKIGMSTGWSNYILRDGIFKSWFKFYLVEGYSSDPIDNEISKKNSITMPMRCFSLEQVVNNELVWDFRGISIKFTAMEYFIVSHCSGKLSVYEIVELVRGKFLNGQEAFDRIFYDVVNYMNSLIDHCLMIKRELV
ncbi:MAG: B12-binding domain-containing radical SAM protein [Bacteriovoracaceae bacterium]